MTLEQALEHLAGLRYPKQVDVVDGVMAQVAHTTRVRAFTPMRRQLRYAAVVVAAVAAAATLNALLSRSGRYNNEDMGMAIMQFNDYASWNAVEEAAVNPIEYLYDE